MPLRTAAKHCPHAIFVDGHPERYRECSEKVYEVLTSFSPQVEMASIDEAYIDMTATGGARTGETNGCLWSGPGEEAKFLAPLDVREIPGVGKVMESNLHALGIKKVGDLARLEETELEERFGKWGLALAGKTGGEDAGRWVGHHGSGD